MKLQRVLIYRYSAGQAQPGIRLFFVLKCWHWIILMDVDRNELAEALGLSLKMITHLVKEGMPKKSRGVYNLPDCVQWYVQKWRDKANGVGSRSTDEERRALLTAQTTKINLENARSRGELLQVEEVAHLYYQAAVIYSTGLDGLAPRVSSEIVGLTDVAKINEIIFRECRAIRSSVSQKFGDLADNQDGIK